MNILNNMGTNIKLFNYNKRLRAIRSAANQAVSLSLARSLSQIIRMVNVDATKSLVAVEGKNKNKKKKGSVKRRKDNKLISKDIENVEEIDEGNVISDDEFVGQDERKMEKVEVSLDECELEKQNQIEIAKGEEEEGEEDGEEEEGNDHRTSEEKSKSKDDRKEEVRKKKRKERLMKEAAEAARRGICYMSRIPPHMDHVKLRHILKQYGDILRIYLVPEDPAARVHRKKAGGFRGQGFSEGWVEFADKRLAKRVADMLNGEQMGGKKRSQFYYDLWNIKYLSKFKWDDITEEIAFKNASRQQKLELELSAAKRERDMFISNVEKATAQTHIEERLKKKRKIVQDSGADPALPVSQQAGQAVRLLSQKKPVADKAGKGKRGLSKETLAGIFGGSS